MNSNDTNQTSIVLTELEKSLPPGLANELGLSVPQDETLSDLGVHVENVAFHDFATYEYVFDPYPPLPQPETIDFTSRERALIDSLFHPLYGQESPYDEQLVLELCGYVVAGYRSALRKLHPEFSEDQVQNYVFWTLATFLSYGLAPVYARYALLPQDARITIFQALFFPFLADCASVPKVPLISDWVPVLDEFASGRGLRFFPAGSVNFGIRLIYRQEWRTLGNQDGELVRTIPLAPGQKEKVSVKLLRRNKGTRQLERITATETTTETADSTKDSSEIVEEAAQSVKAHVEAEAGYSGFGFSAKVSAGYASENAEKSSEAKKKLSETMQKTANKMRRESKLAVSTESEESFEETQASEIANPNDEIPITLVYHRLQRAYEIHTYLAEVASVVFVAEPMPSIGEDWIQRYDWIIAKVLLDESFRGVLDWLSKQGESRVTASEEGAEAMLGTFLHSASKSIENVATLPGGSITNIYDSAVEGYRAAMADAKARQTDADTMKGQVQRLIRHIRDNVLHYCRAVWSSEDPEARMLRYMNIYTPSKVTWEPIPELSGTESDPSRSKRSAVPARELHAPSSVVKSGIWKISPEASDFVPLSDVINPAGPIGFFGNYAVFHVKDGIVAGLNEALAYYRLQYSEPSEIFIVSSEQNFGSADVKTQITRPFVLSYYPYDLRFRKTAGHLRYVLNVSVAPESAKVVSEGDYPSSGLILDLTKGHGFKLIVTGAPEDGDTFTIFAAHPELCDPELKILREQYPVPGAPEARAILFQDKLVVEMVDLMPGLRQTLTSMEPANGGDDTLTTLTWGTLSLEQRDYLVSVYHDFLMRREHTRRFVVDTNSLVVSVYAGSGSTLEPFKRAHRFLDVVKAATEVQRRTELIAHEKYGDPDIERVVVVTKSDSGLASLVAGVESEEARSEANKVGVTSNP